jgi:hypothetical protein
MYHWDRMDSATDETGRRATTPKARNHAAASDGEAGRGVAPSRRGAAALAVQVALDRRDNGGDLGATRDE